MTARRYHLTSYGCQMNKLDSELVESKLRQRGYEAAADEAQADVVLLNTCSVRQHAEDRVWSKLGKLRLRKREDPTLVVGVLGCMAQEHKRYLLSRMPHVDLVVGPSAFGDIDATVELAREKNARIAAEREPARTRHEVAGAGVLAVDQGQSGDSIRRDVRVRPHRSQAFVSVMRGCNMPCTYCIVPTTRGDEVSRPIADLVEEAQRLCDDGVTEITLLGQTVNAYGRDLRGQNATLARLLRALHEIPSLRRLAFITSHPNFLSPELVAAMAELPKMARYLHLPAQSGSNAVLKAMRRGYTVERYLARIEHLLTAAPGYELHSDFIVGYPGETAADFDATVAFLQRVGFAQSYVFKYLPRPGTIAAELPDDVPDDEKERRNQVLLAAQSELTMAANRRLVGQTVEVLIEGASKVAGRLSGRTVHHRLVHFAATDPDLVGTFVPVRVTEALQHSVVGELLDAAAAQSSGHDLARDALDRTGLDGKGPRVNFEPCMQEALQLAQRGRGEVEPNPRVGCVLLQDGEIVGRGYHRYFGGPHAEAGALAEAAATGRKPDTAVVTLEPCSTPKGQSGKKTEPCAQALAAAGVRRVVIGSLDPDPRHRRQGIALLEAAGVEVIDGVLASQCESLHETFRKALSLDRPWTLCKWAMTLDGKTAAPTGEARWISGPEARRRTHELRARCCAVMVGFRTAQIDDPELTVRHVDGKQPIRIVVDPLGEIDDDSNLVRTARQQPTWLLASEDVDPRRSGHLQDLGVTVVHIATAEGPRRLNLGQAFAELRRRGLRRVLVEGGGGLVAQMLAWNCVDQVLAFVAPKLIGGQLAPTPVGGDGRPFMAEAWQLRDMRFEACGDDVAISGFV